MSGEGEPSRAVRAVLYFGTFLVTALASGHLLAAYGLSGAPRWALSLVAGAALGLLSELLYLRSFR